MSLQVWIPFNGTVKNQGPYSSTITNHNATIDTTTPKLQQDYLFNGTNAYLKGTYNATQNISFCCWVYMVTVKNGHILDARTNDSKGYQPMYYSTSSGIQIGGSGSSYQYIPCTLTANTWTHICVTHDATCGKLYINGQLKGTNTSAKGFNAGECNFTLGSRWNQGNYSNIKVNDLRIYDHCLSPLEVQEISECLLLHYPLNDYNIIDRRNYVTTMSAYNSYWTIDNQVSNGQYIRLKKNTATSSNVVALNCSAITSNMSANETWTMSCFLYKNGQPYKTSSTKVSTYGRFSNTLSSESNDNGYFRVTFKTGSSSDSWVIHEQWFGTGNADGQLVEIKNLQFEKSEKATPYISGEKPKSNIVYDCSGYGINGTVINTPSIDYNSPRYAISLLNNSSSKIQLVNITPSIFSVSFWMKRSRNTGTRQFMYTSWQGVTCELNANGTMRFQINNSSNQQVGVSSSTTALVEDGWIHFCGTYDGVNTIILYKNGVEIGRNTSTGVVRWNSTSNYIETYSTFACFEGNLSDFRLYATCLSENTVKRIYNSSLALNKHEQVHCYELNEYYPTKAFKNGLLSTKEFRQKEKSSSNPSVNFNKEFISASEFIER